MSRRLTPEERGQIIDAILLRRTLTNKRLAHRFGVSLGCIGGIVAKVTKMTAIRPRHPGTRMQA